METKLPTAGPSSEVMMLADGATTGITIAPRNAPAAVAKPLADRMSLAVKLDLDVQAPTDCFNVATETADLGTRDTTAL